MDNQELTRGLHQLTAERLSLGGGDRKRISKT